MLTLRSFAQISDAIVEELYAIATGKFENNTCSQCVASVEIFHIASLVLSQDAITDVLIAGGNALNLTSLVDYGTCENYFSGTGGLGPYFTQLLQKMSLETGDMQAFCYYEFALCTAPSVVQINENDWFSPKPANKTTAPAPSGKTVDVLHFSDWHSKSSVCIAANQIHHADC